MIRLLIGKPMFFGNECVVLCGGVGYGVNINEKTAQHVRTAQEVTLHIYTHVREDALQLFGFLTAEDKHLFELVLDVSGVGPKTALALTNTQVQTLIQAVQEGDVSFFTAIPRVGKKLAQKIIIELKPKLGSIQELNLADEDTHHRDIREALEALGYTPQDIHRALQHIMVDTLTTQEAIKQCVRTLAKAKI